jgi:putative nucleotidyltransferase with HDIG domain
MDQSAKRRDMGKLVQLPVGNLQQGMVVVKFDCAEPTFAYFGKPLPADCNPVLTTLLDNGVSYAFVDDSTLPANMVITDTPSGAMGELQTFLDAQQSSMDDTYRPPQSADIAESITLHKEAKQVTAHLMQEARFGKIIDTKLAKNTISAMVSQCVTSPEAFVSVTRLKDFDNYTFTHSVNVSVLAISLGKRLGLSEHDLNALGLAGLLHDIGKMQIPEQILNKPGKLTEAEFNVMKQHAYRGYVYLKSTRSVSEEILQAVRHHHEKSDGSGYPDGLREAKIPKFAKIISVADVYDAITSERVYRKGMLPFEAMCRMFSWSGKQFNDALVRFFISIVGIYPAGTMVMLDTKEVAIIVGPNKNEPLRPRVLIMTDADKNVLEEPVPFDLSERDDDTNAPHKAIISAIDPKEFKININVTLEKYINGGAE